MVDTKLKLEYCALEVSENALPVIVVAAGSSTRMNGINKQTASLCGMPVIARTLTVFENSPHISRIILVTREESINEMQLIADKYMVSKLTDIVCGGNDRHSSVLNGMQALSPDEKRVLIHDGARPFADERIISDCVSALDDAQGCLCGIKINDTIKKVGEQMSVVGTLDRCALYAAQTPQGVQVDLYRKASSEFGDMQFTDDASVLEAAGYTVKMVMGSPKNIKITTAEDLILAESIVMKGE